VILIAEIDNLRVLIDDLLRLFTVADLVDFVFHDVSGCSRFRFRRLGEDDSWNQNRCDNQSLGIVFFMTTSLREFPFGFRYRLILYPDWA
jgi:hypothetical protein